MDTSNRLQFVLGEFHVQSHDLQPEEWLEVVERVRKICMPQLRYVDGFEEIRNVMKRIWEQAAIAPMSIDEPVSEGITLTTRCLLMGAAHYLDSSDSELQKRRMSHDALLLTQGGVWVRVKTLLEQVQISGGPPGARSVRRGISSRLELLERGDLLKLLTTPNRFHPGLLGSRVVWVILRVFSATVETKRERLSNLEQRERELRGIAQRLSLNIGVSTA